MMMTEDMVEDAAVQKPKKKRGGILNSIRKKKTDTEATNSAAAADAHVNKKDTGEDKHNDHNNSDDEEWEGSAPSAQDINNERSNPENGNEGGKAKPRASLFGNAAAKLKEKVFPVHF